MAYVRKKTVAGIAYFYLVSGQRINGRVCQKVLVYLGKHATVEDAFQYWQHESKKPERKIHAERMLRKLKPFLQDK